MKRKKKRKVTILHKVSIGTRGNDAITIRNGVENFEILLFPINREYRGNVAASAKLGRRSNVKHRSKEAQGNGTNL
jgi:hypothetical protein